MHVKNRLQVVSNALVPTKFGAFNMHVFRDSSTTNNIYGLSLDHIAVSMGDLKNKKNVITRIHSECLTSEVFGSLKCDCKDQLEYSQKLISKEGCGIILYLRQEGRGIGLANKIQAYRLQSQGVDTVDANRNLNLPDDLRDYSIAAEMINHLGIISIQLLTNNPLKLESIKSQGINAKRLSIICPVNSHSEAYLESKRERMGHILPKLLI